MLYIVANGEISRLVAIPEATFAVGCAIVESRDVWHIRTADRGIRIINGRITIERIVRVSDDDAARVRFLKQVPVVIVLIADRALSGLLAEVNRFNEL